MKRINPLSRRPHQGRLVVAVRGAAGVGKSYFAASLAEAGVGRLCFLDVERKGRLLPGASGANPTFDAIEIHHPDELPEFIDWALDGEGREQGYGCYALDSWGIWFARKHQNTLRAVRERSGDPTAEPNADQLQADQILYQEVLRRLCMDSGACVVITDHIAAKGKEQGEENELGQVVPITRGGLEYFIDVMLELSLRMDGFDTTRVATVVKSNSQDFPVGLQLENPTFKTLLERMGTPAEPVIEDGVPAFLKSEASITPAGPGLDDLIQEAEAFGIDRARLLLAAKGYHKVGGLEALSEAQIADLLERMNERYGTNAQTPKGAKRRGGGQAA